MPPRTSHANAPFAVFLRKRHLAVNRDLGLFKNIAKRLIAQPHTVSPNSPMFPLFAQFLKCSPKMLQSFAHGPPMSDQFVKKIQLQLDRGTIPRGEKLATANQRFKHERPMKRPNHDAGDSHASEDTADSAPESQERERIPANATAFLRYVMERTNRTLQSIAKQTNIPITSLWRMSGGNMPPNHPVVGAVAEAVGLPTADLAAFMTEDPLTDSGLARGQRILDKYRAAGVDRSNRAASRKAGHPQRAPQTPMKRKRGRPKGSSSTAVVLHEGTVSNGVARQLATAKHNRLGSKRTALTLRDSARAMVATLNITIMRGDTHMPPLPVGDLYLVLQDYLVEKGVKANVLVDPAFANLFDPR